LSVLIFLAIWNNCISRLHRILYNSSSRVLKISLWLFLIWNHHYVISGICDLHGFNMKNCRPVRFLVTFPLFLVHHVEDVRMILIFIHWNFWISNSIDYIWFSNSGRGPVVAPSQILRIMRSCDISDYRMCFRDRTWLV
jgi:hypothetical protein